MTPETPQPNALYLKNRQPGPNYYDRAGDKIARLWDGSKRLVKLGRKLTAEPTVEDREIPAMHVRTGRVQIPDCPDHFPTNWRSFTAVDMEQADPIRPGTTHVLMVPGYSGSGMKMLAGDLGEVVATAALQEGHGKVRMMGVNDSGRATLHYTRGKDALAKITRRDQVADADRTTMALIEEGVISGEKGDSVVIVGHSLGQQKALGVLEAVLEMTPMRVQAIVNINGASDARWGLGRDLRFLNAVRPHTPEALKQAVMGSGAMEIMADAAAYARAMFGLKEPTHVTEQHRRFAVADSARAFLDVTMQLDTGHLDRLVGEHGDRLRSARIVTVTATDENLLPDRTKAQSARYARHRLNEVGKLEVPTSHSIPTCMTAEQQAAFSKVFRLALARF